MGTFRAVPRVLRPVSASADPAKDGTWKGNRKQSDPPASPFGGPAEGRPIMQHVREWPIRLYFFEEDGQTQARVWLKPDAHALEAVGEARCEPQEFDVPEIGDEIAAARALIALGGKLLHTGETDVEDLRGAPVHIDS